MESREGTTNEEETIKQENQKWKETLRKRKINEKIFQSRHAPSQSEAQNVLQEQYEPEEQEVQIKEESGRKRPYLPVNQRSKKHIWKNKKKCW